MSAKITFLLALACFVAANTIPIHHPFTADNLIEDHSIVKSSTKVLAKQSEDLSYHRNGKARNVFARTFHKVLALQHKLINKVWSFLVSPFRKAIAMYNSVFHEVNPNVLAQSNPKKFQHTHIHSFN